jgi:gamma-glutamyltranspeptidase/glutathione hydrolase
MRIPISFGLFIAIVGCSSTPSSSIPPKRANAAQESTYKTAFHEMVVSYHPIASQIGYDILKQGGNAFDAFVATTAAQYVLSEGVTSVGGPLGALVFDARTKESEFINATFNDPLDQRQKWDAKDPKPGRAVLVPGAPAGLEAISKKYGKLPFGEVLKPAIRLAENGFPISKMYAALLRSPYGDKLKQSPYAQRTFFHDGVPLAEGEILKLPELAKFFKRLAAQGSKYVYRGAWSKKAIKEVSSHGGFLNGADFSSYTVEFEKPWKISYRDFEIYSPQNSGGLNTLLSLKVLEHTNIEKMGHFSTSADALETMARIQYEVSREPWLYDQDKVKDSALVESKLAEGNSTEIWNRVQKKIKESANPNEGTHSYHVVVIDSDGNAITGTNTIESFPWGNDIFVEGVALTAAGQLPFSTKPGKRRRSDLSMQIGVKGNKVRFASGAFSASLVPAEFQFITNIVDYKMSAQQTVTTPRFGSFAWDMQTLKPTGAVWLDPRVDKSVVEKLAGRGIPFIQTGYIDTGLGSVAVVNEDGTMEGAFAPLSSVGSAPNKFVGIGAVLDINEKHQIVVKEVLPNSPAAKIGMVAGDVILSVQLKSESSPTIVTGKSIPEVISLLKGERGTHVWIEIQNSQGEIRTFDIVRDEVSRNPSSVETPICTPACSNNLVCMNSFTDAGAQCLAVPEEAPLPDLVLPFDANTEAVCTHSSGSGSHSGTNAYYALDLATDYSLPAATVRAAADGVAYVFLGEDGKLCPEPSGTPASAQSSTCGQSWGNHIRILHENGYMSFYVHLDHPLVANGTFVHKGDPIGIEGWTGAAGHRHLHWSIQKLPGANQSDWINHISWAGTSVPFHFKAQQNGAVQNFEAKNIQCAHAAIGQAPADQQPRFKGVQ